MNFRCLIALLLVLPALSASAQQGHPLTGTWQGDWELAGEDDGHFLTLIMDWDGKAITGIANPGPDSTPIGRITLDSANWTVAIEMDIKDGAGETIPFEGTGTLVNVTEQTRSISGTWTGHADGGSFTLTRQSGP
ncbi:MAG TPA: hypothetical protein VNR18_08415 [Hyphomicrobiales bacterium]|nr:hypothetical protein [Hyphomicrobiales bacterium]